MIASGGNLAPRFSNLARGKNEITNREWTRATKATQIYTGVTIAGFLVVSEAPFRDQAGRLVWSCECPAAKHRVEVLHDALTYAAPTCSECGRQAVLASLGGKETEAEFQQWWEQHSIPRNRIFASGATRASERIKKWARKRIRK